MTDIYMEPKFIGDRVFIDPGKGYGKYSRSEVNLEYKAVIDYHGHARIQRGGVLPRTEEKIKFNISGKLFMSPVDSRDIVHSYEKENHVTLDFKIGAMKGTRIEADAEQKKYASWSVPEKYLSMVLRGIFPEMRMQGNLVFATEERLPGDIHETRMCYCVHDALTGSKELQRLSEAHKAFMELYERKNEEN